MGADRVGIPAYGVVAGLGVGGLAIALAAQSTIENLIGGLSLFADKPVRVGDLCKCGSDEGTVEAIGLRSTRIRSLDRTLTTIPNAALAKMAIENLAERDRILIQTVIGVRYETRPEQLRYLLVKILELLVSHPRIHAASARARLIGFAASSLDIEVFAYVLTRDKLEFLAVRQDVLLRIMEIVEQSGTSFAFPSQNVYFSKDSGLDTVKADEAEAQMRQWRQEGHQVLSNALPEAVLQKL
jgi:MscS family membrane protein